MNIEKERRRFEKWVAAPPFEYDVARHPCDPSYYAWPGQYKDIRVCLAWDAWCEAINNAGMETVASPDSKVKERRVPPPPH